MRDLHFQTTQRDQTPANRRPKTAPDLNRHPHKVAKDVAAVFCYTESPAGQRGPLDSLKEISEASDDYPFPEPAGNSFDSVHTSETHSSEKVDVSDLTSTLSSVTDAPHEHVNSDTANTKRPEVDSFKMTSVEAEVVIKRLREVRIQVLKSKDLGPSKKLVEALINVTIEDFGGLYEINEWLDKILSRKSNLVFLSCIMVIFSLLMVWFFDWSSKGFTGPTPT